MGAYSSWAMLALSHHVILHYSAHLVGEYNFKNYCILGDDIVINNDKVAAKYLSVMEHLGVSINLAKSVISYDFTEFAKKLKGPKLVNFTPIGAGIILRTVRDKAYVPGLLAEAMHNKLYNTYHTSMNFLQSLPRNYTFGKFVGL